MSLQALYYKKKKSVQIKAIGPGACMQDCMHMHATWSSAQQLEPAQSRVICEVIGSCKGYLRQVIYKVSKPKMSFQEYYMSFQ